MNLINLEEKDINISIKEIENFQSFWDIQPSWQSSIKVLENIRQSCTILGAYKNEQLGGYIIYNPAVKKIYQIAVDQNFRRQGIGTKLLSTIEKMNEGQAISVNNVDDTSAFLHAAGLKNWVPQFEMKRDI